MPGDCSAETPCPARQVCNAEHRCEAEVTDCQDGDGDGYGPGCEDGADCDDQDPQVHPGMKEDDGTLCDDGVDNDCQGGDVPCGDRDDDGDGVTAKNGTVTTTIRTSTPGPRRCPTTARTTTVRTAT